MLTVLNKPAIFSFVLTLIFFTIGFVTLKDYAVSWDEAMHYRRAHAVLFYFLTGDKNYANLPSVNLQGTKGDPSVIPEPRRSFYQNDINNYTYFYDDWGHPPLNGLMAASLNYIFYQNLGIMDDIESHHLFNLLASSLFVFIVTYFAFITLGRFAAVVSFLTVVTYPLFFAESHFNVKDPAESAFISATIFFFYKSLEKLNLKWLILSILAFGFALGTKFNALFVPFIIIPYLIVRYRSSLKNFKNIFKEDKLRIFSLVLITAGTVIPLVMLIAPWPYLWKIENLLRVLVFYKEIGSGVNYQGDGFLIAGFNLFPLLWILFTTSILVLILSVVGVIVGFSDKSFKDKFPLLWILWLFIPILRVSLPGTSLYGGVRQILEFLPAMSLLAGLGAYKIRNILTKRGVSSFLISGTIIFLFIFPILSLIKLHPYENVYFNFLIGGLNGAKEKNFPSWGNSYGSAYLDGINWINQNSEKNSKLSLIQGTRANVPDILLRKDIDFNNSNFSGIEKDGEYLMELIFNDTAKFNYYAWDYVNNFLDPVYELKRDDVTILKIWKNDAEHTWKDVKSSERKLESGINSEIDKQIVKITLSKPVYLSKIVINPLELEDCEEAREGYVEISLDGKKWEMKKDTFEFQQVRPFQEKKLTNLTYYFAGDYTSFVNFIVNKNACILKGNKIDVYIF
ncbi:MAG: glycosyltransferase [uncultured bacterium]|uniref:Glycosyltransferase RgtA/B/C/D-like domain-containing protein n=3 Tax=Candidatus Daviesiibacteriota TaxID=1752718 RepID=A0A0G0FAU7_9BACT|nr:MAG: glycosyltransferase [uncultured bacterium]KKQ10630.1 MAG: hypothetical protein US19_C0002G0049 [Candidatus Daviesbacteria bacterium GW2011_GWB1_36_5]KKQ15103.1 MAG: hypothetical protein US28_C0023G0004 [Candidatus Daviesbacteria bacterium GW2011_GWA1_36_8]OGE17822.1 MAG: hypothetical protein A2858_03705 [Candidatus Daviesbacteria bacterium RIFCSPHIGHO2_01_FULL_36_37]